MCIFALPAPLHAGPANPANPPAHRTHVVQREQPHGVCRLTDARYVRSWPGYIVQGLEAKWTPAAEGLHCGHVSDCTACPKKSPSFFLGNGLAWQRERRHHYLRTLQGTLLALLSVPHTAKTKAFCLDDVIFDRFTYLKKKIGNKKAKQNYHTVCPTYHKTCRMEVTAGGG